VGVIEREGFDTEPVIGSQTAEDADVRLIPISLKLAGFLEMAKTDAAGKDSARPSASLQPPLP
jgi:hypothetical protein